LRRLQHGNRWRWWWRWHAAAVCHVRCWDDSNGWSWWRRRWRWGLRSGSAAAVAGVAERLLVGPDLACGALSSLLSLWDVFMSMEIDAGRYGCRGRRRRQVLPVRAAQLRCVCVLMSCSVTPFTFYTSFR